jgi:hypothetical protein
MPLALKIPVIIIPPREDPFTHFILIEALRAVDKELASCIQFVPCAENVWTNLLNRVDRIIIPQSVEDKVSYSDKLFSKTHLIHFGRCKLLIDDSWNQETVDVAFRRMNWKHGRTCTGLTSIISRRHTDEFCISLARKLINTFSDDFTVNRDRLALFPVDQAKKINEEIEALINLGGVEDVTQKMSGKPRLISNGREAILLPTVLRVKQYPHRAFGLELPFPFISVIEADSEEQMITLARNSLIVSLISQNQGLRERLCQEVSILKIFGGEHVERGYHYLDPQEGYIADFLYQKKAVAY